jgi:hypothetical protein
MLVVHLMFGFDFFHANHQPKVPLLFDNDYDFQRLKRSYPNDIFLRFKANMRLSSTIESMLDSPYSNDSDHRPSYTRQNLLDVTRIIQTAPYDYYGILNLEHPTTTLKINKAHRKLTLRVHPDKNHAPGAVIATQRLNKARDELLKFMITDETSRMNEIVSLHC